MKKEYIKPEIEIHKFKKFFYFCNCNGSGTTTACGGTDTDTTTLPVTGLDAAGTCMTT